MLLNIRPEFADMVNELAPEMPNNARRFIAEYSAQQAEALAKMSGTGLGYDQEVERRIDAVMAAGSLRLLDVPDLKEQDARDRVETSLREAADAIRGAP